MWIRLLRSVVLIRCGAGPQVEQPLCELCCHNVETSMRADMEALKEEADAYEAALERLQAEAPACLEAKATACAGSAGTGSVPSQCMPLELVRISRYSVAGASSESLTTSVISASLQTCKGGAGRQ